MKTMQKAFKKQGQQLSMSIIIPFTVFVIGLSFFAGISFFNAMLNDVNAKSEEFVKELTYEFISVESVFNSLLKELLQKNYTTGFDDITIQKLTNTLLTTESKFPIDSVNYYRLTEGFVIYDTDYKPDLDRDFSDSQYFIKNLSELKPGEVFYDSLINEVNTGDVRLYGYIKMRDGSYFEIGVKFQNIKETIQKIANSIFGSSTDKISMYETYTSDEFDYFARSLESRKPFFILNSMENASYYVKKHSQYGNYSFIIHSHFYFFSYLLGTSILLAVLLFVFLRLINRHVKRLSVDFSQNIEKLERNVKKFRLSDFSSKTEEINSDIMEINSISKSFNMMREDIMSSYEQMNAMNRELEVSYQENQQLLSKVEVLLNVPDYLLYLNNTEKFLKRSFERVLLLINEIDYGFVAVIEDGIYRFLDFKGMDINLMNELGLIDSEYVRSDVVALINYEEGEYLASHNNRPEIRKELDSISQVLSIPISTDNGYLGSITLMTKRDSGNQLSEDDYKIASYFTNYLQGYLLIKELSEKEEEIQKETVYSLIRLLEKHDTYTKGHSESVARLASKFAYYLELSEEKAQDLYWAGIVHDMGKILIPHSILNKPSRLTAEEFDLIKMHPVYAWDVLRKNNKMENIATYIRHHHEKYDGTGYPDGLKGEEIPFESRLLTLADSWDAMTAERVYKSGMTVETALEEIKSNAGKHFDPELAKEWISFIQSEKEYNQSA